MNWFLSLLVMISLTLLLADCQKDSGAVTNACTPPAMLTAQAQCESGYPGALLISSEYKLATSSQFEYQIYVQPDTLSNNIAKTNNSWGNASNERIIVPEAVLKNAPKFVVQVIVNCGGTLYPSRPFAFVKRTVGSSGCYVWARQAN